FLVHDQTLPVCRHVALEANEREHDNREYTWVFKRAAVMSAIAWLVPEMADSVETHKLGCEEEGFVSRINVRICLFTICWIMTQRCSKAPTYTSILVTQTIPKIKDPVVQYDKLANQTTGDVDSIHCKLDFAKLGEGLGKTKDTSSNTCLTGWHPLPGFFCRRITANLVLGVVIA
ncbi:hypothetical protein J3A83DRAFT_4212913, partial [Scleroderma citrinum]